MKGRGNKFGAKKTPCLYGHMHDSKGESLRCNELHEEESAERIADLVIQPRYFFSIDGVKVKGINGHQLRYTPDFAYLDRATGRTVVEDFKGMRDRAYGVRSAFFRALYPEIDFRETRA